MDLHTWINLKWINRSLLTFKKIASKFFQTKHENLHPKVTM